MATQLTKNAQNVFKLFNLAKNNNIKYNFGQLRAKVTTKTGAVSDKPHKVAFGVPRVILTVLPGLYLGATLSKEGAAFLEENDIFVPSEDDDDD